MDVPTLREWLSRRPFAPFRLVMSGGHAYDIRHPDTARLSRTDLYVGVDVGDDGIPDDFRICSLDRIDTVEPLGPVGLGE